MLTIVEEKRKDTTRLGSLDLGDTFEYNHDIFMVICEEADETTKDDYHNYQLVETKTGNELDPLIKTLAIRLVTGSTYIFDNDIQVIPVKIEATIKYYED